MDDSDRQQINYPLDQTSREIIQEDLPVFQNSVPGTPTTNGYIVVKINGQLYKIMTAA